MAGRRREVRAPRLEHARGGPDAPPPRNLERDIWAADVHMTPNGKFLCISERASSTLGGFSVDEQTGKGANWAEDRQLRLIGRGGHQRTVDGTALMLSAGA